MDDMLPVLLFIVAGRSVGPDALIQVWNNLWVFMPVNYWAGSFVIGELWHLDLAELQPE